MLHNASLLIDDIEDNSNLRRGIPVAHNIYGVPQTINSANYVYFLGLEKVLQLDHPESTKVYSSAIGTASWARYGHLLEGCSGVSHRGGVQGHGYKKNWRTIWFSCWINATL